MMRGGVVAILVCGAATAGLADGLGSFGTLYGRDRVETEDRLVVIDSLDDNVRFAITLRDKTTGVERRHVFDGQGASDPSPYLWAEAYYCDASVILLTIEFPWRHALPQYGRVLETYAFGRADLGFIDVVSVPSSDIALQDMGGEGEMDAEMLPPVGVRCLAEPGGRPFAFVEREAS